MSKKITVSKAIGEALHEEMLRDDKVFIMGEDMAVMGNVFELVTALRNAVENAFKYGAPEKGIALRLWADNEHGQARLMVADRGPGIADDDIHRVFKRFVRLEAGGNLEGSGLGLPLVRGVLQHHKGWAWAESAPGEGFKLHMALPLYAGLPS